MKRPFDSIKDLHFENLERIRENQLLNFSRLDNYMVWLVGFSIGGLSIIVTKITAFDNVFTHKVLKCVLALLTTSIVSGIIYRWAYFRYQSAYQSCEFYLKSALSNSEMITIEPDNLDNETDIKEVARHIKLAFGEDLTNVLELYNKSDNVIKERLLVDLKNHYKKTSDWAKVDFELGKKYVVETFQKAFALSKKEMRVMFESDPAKLMKIFINLSGITFLISCLSFIAVIIILTALY